MSVPSESTELEVLISNPIGEAPDKERKVPVEDALRLLLRFGPVYGEDTKEAHRLLKDAAWQHILRSEHDEAAILFSISCIKASLMLAYDDKKIMIKLRPGEAFEMTMAKDGCLFLQLALQILGAGKLLGYPPDDYYFGERSDHPCKWIPDMFFLGNQIPYHVIDALMNKDFFKDVIGRGKWRRPSDGDVVKLALYQTVMDPQLMTWRRASDDRPRDFSIVTALRNVLLGSNTDDDPSDAAVTRRWFRDLEHGHNDNNPVHFPSATELKRSGVNLRKAKGGIANIRFKNRGYSASLYLPPFHIHGHYIFPSLTSVVQLEKSLPEMEREVTSYVSLMRDLTPTYKDFNILKDQGILIFPAHNLRDAESGILDLNKVVPHSDSFLTPNLRDILRGIKEYETVPWQRMSFTCSIACGIITFFLAVFTIVQTVFTVLSYYNTINPPT